tara:strand:+ start:327 stop:518 length:192 start_codon:yes stop_codon:yes gene_type:complete
MEEEERYLDEEESIKDLVNTLQERMLEVDLLNQVSLALEFKEWFLEKEGSEVLYVSEVIKQKE